jgi:hypothetical protein
MDKRIKYDDTFYEKSHNPYFLNKIKFIILKYTYVLQDGLHHFFYLQHDISQNIQKFNDMQHFIDMQKNFICLPQEISQCIQQFNDMQHFGICSKQDMSQGIHQFIEYNNSVIYNISFKYIGFMY